MHKKSYQSRLLRLVNQKLSEISSWLNSQSEVGNIRLANIRQTHSQLANIQSVMSKCLGTDESVINIHDLIRQAEMCLKTSLEYDLKKQVGYFELFWAEFV